MANASGNDVKTILARSVRLTLFVALRRTRDPRRLEEMLSAHLEWMVGEEKRGRIFLSGSAKAGVGGSPPDGITVVRASDMGEAEALIREDPLVAGGIVDVEMCEWTVNEGMIPLRLTLSDATFCVP